MNRIETYLEGMTSVAIAGHVNPDGDCVGSTLGLYLYLKENYPQLKVDWYLEFVRPEFYFLKDSDKFLNTWDQKTKYDLFITLDTSTLDRIGVAGESFAQAEKTLCIDHHVSNPGFGDQNHIVPEASSASEVIYEMMKEECISKEAAEALYTGIVHDTGVFQFACTGSRTMEIAGKLMAKGIDFTKIIDESFNQRTYNQQQVLGRALSESVRILDGKCIVGVVTESMMNEYGVQKQDLGGIVAQLRLTAGVEVAVFLYETGPKEYKVSLRSNTYVDVNRIAMQFGGGGHVRAAGCNMSGDIQDAINNLALPIGQALKEHDD